MDNEQAIRIIKDCKEKSFKRTLYTLNEYHEAIDMAIEALEQEPCESRQAVIVMCKDCRKHNVSVGYQKDCCPLYEFRGMSFGHEHDYQFCCYAERRTDE